MFDDAKEELERINGQLLAQQETQQETQLLDEETIDAFLEETQIGEASGQYQNFSNGYNTYNTDAADVDLESYSQEVMEPKKDRSLTFLTVLACCLTGAIVLVVLFGWLYLRKMI